MKKDKEEEKMRTYRTNNMKQVRNIFFVYDKKLEQVSEFKYLGRILTDTDDDTKATDNQLRKAKQQWNSIAKLLKREGANANTKAKFYVAVVQTVLLYGTDSWVITEKNWKKLRSFPNHALRHMTGKHILKKDENAWEYPCHTDLNGNAVYLA